MNKNDGEKRTYIIQMVILTKYKTVANSTIKQLKQAITVYKVT